MDLCVGKQAALPPFVSAVKLRLPDFLLCERRKAGICSHTADSDSGKVYLHDFHPSKLRKTFKWNPTVSCLFFKILVGSRVPALVRTTGDGHV